MNLLFTLNKKYIPQLIILLKSIFKTNDGEFNIYIISKELDENDIKKIKKSINKEFNITLIPFDDKLLVGSPTSKRYPLEIYYRLFSAKVLPNDVDRVLYLDPDIVVINKLDELYNMDFEDNYFIGATHVRNLLRKFNEIRVKAPKDSPYVNTGVLLINIKKLREEQEVDSVYKFIEKHKRKFTLPDQDVICGLYGDKVKLVNQYIYNLSDRIIALNNLTSKEKIDLDWVKKNTVIIHYCGRNKPWKKKYRGILGGFYKEFEVVN
jgi:lipopolysaccharide biosynthesis glycosyltransferase